MFLLALQHSDLEMYTDHIVTLGIDFAPRYVEKKLHFLL